MTSINDISVDDIASEAGLLMKTDFGLQETEDQIRAKIARLEEALSKMEQIDLPLLHTFTTGIYAREIFIPKGAIVVGKIHRHDHMNFISSGDVTVLTKEGLKRIVGPSTMVSTAGTKRAVYAHEDTFWTTVHANPTEERDVDKLESFIIAKKYDDLAIEHKFEVMP